jgi:hypothetical protein
MDAMMLDRREFVRVLFADRGDLLVVTGLGSATYDAAAAGDLSLGCDGRHRMIGLGLALARPDRRVAVITGDGDCLMGLGSLATIGVKQPKNLGIVVLDNAHYGETGMQASATHSGIDPVAVACRFKQARHVSRIEEAGEVRALLHSGEGPLLVNARITSEDTPSVLPLRAGHAIKERFIAALK